MQEDPMEGLPNLHEDDDDYIDTIETTFTWGDWRQNLANQMFMHKCIEDKVILLYYAN